MPPLRAIAVCGSYAECSTARAEFTLITHWESWDAIKAFAGADYEKAVYFSPRREVSAADASEDRAL
jgi:hypothetical protein